MYFLPIKFSSLLSICPTIFSSVLRGMIRSLPHSRRQVCMLHSTRASFSLSEEQGRFFVSKISPTEKTIIAQLPHLTI
jgi:hypothetical protein